MHTKIFTQLDPKFIDQWKKLWEKVSYANYTNSSYWFLSVIENFNYKEFAIIGIYNATGLVGIAALVKERKYGVPFYTVAPSDFVCGNPFLVDLEDANQVKALKERLKYLGNVYLDNVPAELADLLRGSADITDAAINYYTEFKEDDQGNLVMENRKKMLHRIRDIKGKFTLKNFNGTEEEGLKVVFAIDEQSRKQSRGYNTFSGEEMKKFYHILASNFKKNLTIHILYFDETPIAYEIGFKIRKTYFGNQIAFIGEYAQYSPGKVLIVYLLDHLFASGLKYMDFGSGESHIKRMITDQYRQLYQVVMSKNSSIGLYVRTMSKTRAALYSQIHGHVKLYSTYRGIKKALKI